MNQINAGDCETLNKTFNQGHFLVETISRSSNMSRLLLCGQAVTWSRETIPAFILIDNFLLFEYQDKKVDTSLVNVSFCEALSEAASPTATSNTGTMQNKILD